MMEYMSYFKDVMKRNDMKLFNLLFKPTVVIWSDGGLPLVFLWDGEPRFLRGGMTPLFVDCY